jgi:nucleotide-binding universal stress UspA family protein
MFSRILVAIDKPEESQAALDLVRQVATEGLTKVQVLHLREREVSGPAWYSRESRDQASYVAESAVFELRMSGVAAGGNVRHAIVDRIAEAILREAEAFEADLIVLGRPRRGELVTRLLGSVTIRVLRRSGCPVIVAPRRARRKQAVTSTAASDRP